MINYVSFKDFGKERIINVINLWNEEFGFIYPITPELFKRNTYDTKGFSSESSYVAIIDEKIVGFVINKIYDHEIKIAKYDATGFISLIYVKRQMRKLGIGSELLNLSLTYFKSLGVKKVHLGSDYQNFFPGLPKDFKEELPWFIKRGFNSPYETNDLIHYVNHFENYNFKPFKDNVNYQIKFLEKEDILSFKQFMEENFPNRWYAELLDYLKDDYLGSDYVIATNEQNKVCGFVRLGNKNTPTAKIAYSLTYRARFSHLGGIGPIGVDQNIRKNNIAYNLLVFAINYLISEGATEIIIDWTNLLSFYRQFNFQIWKSYFYLNKEI